MMSLFGRENEKHGASEDAFVVVDRRRLRYRDEFLKLFDARQLEGRQHSHTRREIPKMPHREVSPALSESGLDLTSALAGDDGGDVFDFSGNTHAAHVTPGDAQKDILADSDEEGDEAFIATQQAKANRAAAAAAAKPGKKRGAFQSMGLNPALLKAVTRKGFSVPTPIQRKTIPMILDGQDVVGMARTGSGKTAAFVIPMVEKLKAHSVQVGSRAIVMSPSRELALQTLKAIKEFGRGTDLRTVLLVGGESFEEQFSQMTSNPDIIIATPGRFLHLQVEMNLDLSSIKYVVFDEADRLFEQGFAVQLTEILHKLPPSRQTLLFSATLPRSLVEFAKAGLQEPSLVRLDAESKISPDLSSVILTLKSSDKEGALVHILQDVIKIPRADELEASQPKASGANTKKRKRDQQGSGVNPNSDTPTAHSTIVFAATKHHVEYLSTLLKSAGFAVSYVYGTLDQTARRDQVDRFRHGQTNILVVTDVAARGIDIPLLANVVNYDFPSQPKIFIHRVGRTARAGKKGWSYNFVQDSDVPYLLELQLFMGKRLVMGRNQGVSASFADDLVVGSIPRSKLERCTEWVNQLLTNDGDLALLQSVAKKGEKLYQRTRNSASAESAKRAKSVSASQDFNSPNLLYDDEKTRADTAKEAMLKTISGFRPNETVFEIGKKGEASETAEIIKKRREKIRKTNAAKAQHAEADTEDIGNDDTSTLQAFESLSQADEDEVEILEEEEDNDDAASDASDLDNAFSSSAGRANPYADPEFLTYAPRNSNAAEDRGYALDSSTNHSTSGHFATAASSATMDLTADDNASFAMASRPSQMRWDKKSKNYVARSNDVDGSRGAKMVKGESGVKIAASFRSGRFEDWKRRNRIDRLPRVGDREKEGSGGRGGARGGMGRGGSQVAVGRGSGKFMHHKEKEAKAPDKYRDDYFVKKRKLDEKRKGADTGDGDGASTGGGKGGEGGGGGRGGRGAGRGGSGFGAASGRGGRGGKPRSELRGVDDIRKQRVQKQQRRDKNARPPRRGRG